LEDITDAGKVVLPYDLKDSTVFDLRLLKGKRRLQPITGIEIAWINHIGQHHLRRPEKLLKGSSQFVQAID